MNTFKFWLSFSVGVAAGATVALICAPQSGAKTRKHLRRKLDTAGDYLKDQMDDAGDYIKDQASDITKRAGKIYSRGREAAADYKEDLVENLGGAVKNVKSAF